MKSVLISIQPKWCELIANGSKTIEVRKTKPKLDTPFKVYIYCTNNKDMLWILKESERESRRKITSIFTAKDVGGSTKANGKVIGEFVCDEIICGFWISPFADYLQRQSCLSYNEVCDYANGKPIFAWHISDLVIYDKPRELSEFYTKCDEGCEDCDFWKNVRVNADEYDMECSSSVYGHRALTRPPQSWCYVESEVSAE